MCFKYLNVKFLIYFFVLILFTGIIFAQEWQLMGLENEEINCIEIDWSDPDIIYAGSRSDFSSGKTGKFFKSYDGGKNWRTLLNNVTVCDIDIHPVDPDIIYLTLGINYLTIAGILKSTDGGEIWAKADSGVWITSEIGPRILVIDPSNPEKLFVGTGGFGPGCLNLSTNGGNSWKFIYIDSLNGVRSLAIDPINTQNIYIGDSSVDRIFSSNDGGYKWRVISEKPEIGANVLKINIENSNILYAGTLGYGFSLSKDYGETWNKANSGLPINCYISDITLSKDEIFISTISDSGNLIFKSNRNTLIWEKVGNKIFNNEILSLNYSLEKNILYMGTKGIYKYQLLTSNVINSDTKLNNMNQIKINPNPFNSSTYIEYNLETQSIVKLEIYNILGRKIRTLVNKNQNQGNYKILFEAEGLSTGLYLCHLRTEQFTKTKKIILIK